MPFAKRNDELRFLPAQAADTAEGVLFGLGIFGLILAEFAGLFWSGPP